MFQYGKSYIGEIVDQVNCSFYVEEVIVRNFINDFSSFHTFARIIYVVEFSILLIIYRKN